ERVDGAGGIERARGRRVEARVVPHREHALLRRRGKIRLEPGLLRRARRSRDVRVVAVQHDDVPGPELVAVIALAGVTCRRAVVREVRSRRGARIVLVVSPGGISAGLVPDPALTFTAGVVPDRSAEIIVVTHSA